MARRRSRTKKKKPTRRSRASTKKKTAKKTRRRRSAGASAAKASVVVPALVSGLGAGAAVVASRQVNRTAMAQSMMDGWSGDVRAATTATVPAVAMTVAGAFVPKKHPGVRGALIGAGVGLAAGQWGTVAENRLHKAQVKAKLVEKIMSSNAGLSKDAAEKLADEMAGAITNS